MIELLQVSNQDAVDIVMRSCSGDTKQLAKSPGKNCNTYPCSNASPISKSPRISVLKPRRIIHSTSHNMSNVQQEKSVEFCQENGSPPSKCRRISSAKQMKIKSHFSNNENEEVAGKRVCSPLLAACKELADLAVTRGSLDDITVMIVDLNCFRG